MVALELGSSFNEQYGGLVPRGTVGQVRLRASAHLPFHDAREKCLARPSLRGLDQHHVRIWAGPIGLVGTGPKHCSHILEPKRAWVLGAVHNIYVVFFPTPTINLLHMEMQPQPLNN